MKKATVYLDDELHRTLEARSLQSGASISRIVNSAIRDSLAEDLADLAVP